MPQGHPTTPETFWLKAIRVGACLEWQGSTDRRGYGKAYYQGKFQVATRLAWTLARGPIPDGLHVLHTCDNPRCIEPLHLFLGTHQDNMRDATVKGRNALRGRSGVANSQGARLTEDQVREIRAAAATGVSRRTIGAQYGISHQTVTKIVNRLRWASVP